MRITTLPIVRVRRTKMDPRKNHRVHRCYLSSLKVKRMSRLLTVSFLIVCTTGCGPEQETCGNPVADADCVAWSTFTHISRPARNGTRDLFWETWIDGRTVFASETEAPSWPGTVYRPKKLEFSFQAMMFATTVPTNEGFEVRINRPEFDSIVSNRMWNREGLKYAYSHSAVDFPLDSVEVKARWQDIDEGEKATHHWQYVKDSISGYPRLLGLKGLHIASRALPNWQWATWKHVSASDEMKDSFGFPAGGLMSSGLRRMFKLHRLPPELQNYRLIGTQTEFIKPDGKPTLLGNSMIELGTSKNASCITCHSLVRIDSQGCVQSQSVGCDGQCSGAPKPEWFEGKKQLHFV